MNERFVLITGASRGLGKVLSWRFAKEGYGLCLVAQEEKRLNELSIELKQQFKNEIQFISCDLGNSMDIDVLINKTRQKLPRLDVLINNAAISVADSFLSKGGSGDTSIISLSSETIDANFSINTKAAITQINSRLN